MYATDRSRLTGERQLLMALIAQGLIYYAPVPWDKSIMY